MLQNQTIITLLIRLFLGYIFFSAGVCKLTNGNFGQLIGPPWLEQQLATYGLGMFAKVVAISQVICGMLLLSQRYSLLGAIMLVPMNVAILSVTVSMNWVGTPYVNTFFLALNLLLLLFEHRKFRFLLHQNQALTITPGQADTFALNTYSLLGIGFSVATIAVASFNIALTNTFAIAAFAAFAAALFKGSNFSLLEKAIFALPFLAMVTITMADIHSLAVPSLIAIIGIEALLVGFRLYLGMRNKTAEAGATIAVG